MTKSADQRTFAGTAPTHRFRMTREQARAEGYIIDDGQQAVAYKGPRFAPDDWFTVDTVREAELKALIHELIEHLDWIGWGDSYERECAKKLIVKVARFQEENP